jgi:uncharacterized protein YndB with AHSA1/START domain
MATPQPRQPKSGQAKSGEGGTGLTVQVRRTFAAPREKVFAAWTQRDQLEKWMCKDQHDHTVIHHQQDIRTGGRYLLEVHDPGKGEVYWGQGIYREVKPPEKIAFTWSWTRSTPDGQQLHPESPETLVTVEFFARGNATEVVLTHGVFNTQKDFNDHHQGWNGCFDVLAKALQF